MHCGANTYQASSENAVASDQPVGDDRRKLVGHFASPAADIEYTVPSAPTATSRAARPGTSAIEICQLKPSRREHVLQHLAEPCRRCCTGWPGRWRRRGGDGEGRQEPQDHHQREDDAADALQEDGRALPQAERQVAQARHAVRRQLEHQRLVAPLGPDALEDPGHAHRRHHAGHVEHEQASAPRRLKRADAAIRARRRRSAAHRPAGAPSRSSAARS